LVAHFFCRAFGLIRQGGCFGLIATNTIGQGDTRATGLATLLQTGGAIRRAVKRLQWPGAAAVVVSVVHLVKGRIVSPALDGRQVSRISAYLVEGELDESPALLNENEGKSFIGSYLLGMGFTFDAAAAEKDEAESLVKMQALIAKDPRNADRIKPYIGGEEVNNSPIHAHHRYTTDFSDFPLRREPGLNSWARMDERQRATCLSGGIVPTDYPGPVAADWPDLLQIVEQRVRPKRATDGRASYRRNWWRYAERRAKLHPAIKPLPNVIATNCGATPHLALARLPTGMVYAHTLVVFAYSRFAPFGLLQSRVHEIWARFLSSSMKDDLRYAPSDCFETFPFPSGFDADPPLEAAGRVYYDHRATLMVARSEGMTKTYNRFHDTNERSEDIERLRELHNDMDRAVLSAYGWDDLAANAHPQFLTNMTEENHTYQDRLFWLSEFRDEVLARLLKLNAQRHAEEVRLGLAQPNAALRRDGQTEEELDEGMMGARGAASEAHP
jgi:hypothetical protein